MDKLYNWVKERGPICLGLDTALEYIPESIRSRHINKEDQIFAFNRGIIEATKDIVASYKVQIAYYEAEGIQGLMAYKKTLDYIKANKVPVIADIKRGDISKTAQMYAKAHFSGDFEVDAITVNMYMGTDTIEPYYEYLKKGKGIFVLLKTSNPRSGDIQNIKTQTGEFVYHEIMKLLDKKGKELLGQSHYSPIGAVVGCTHPEDGVAIREYMKNTFFLIPGYGAQGGKPQDVVKYLINGNGGIINSSRGLILAYKKETWKGLKFDEAARKATIEMKDTILQQLKLITQG